MSVVGECFFWYRLTRVVPDNFHRAVKRLCVCVMSPYGIWRTGNSCWMFFLLSLVTDMGRSENFIWVCQASVTKTKILMILVMYLQASE